MPTDEQTSSVSEVEGIVAIRKTSHRHLMRVVGLISIGIFTRIKMGVRAAVLLIQLLKRLTLDPSLTRSSRRIRRDERRTGKESGSIVIGIRTTRMTLTRKLRSDVVKTLLAIAGFVVLAGCAATDAGPTPEITYTSLTAAPSARQMASFYPVDAMRKHLAGRAVIRCRVPISGLLAECQIVSATDPAFGAATLKIAHFFRARPATRYGEPVEGTITIPVVWKIAS